MKEYPILFSAPMVRAILDGRKTQTRRIVKYKKQMPPIWATWAEEAKGLMRDMVWRPLGLFKWSEEQTEGVPLKTLRRWPHREDDPYDRYAIPCPYGKSGDQLWVRETFVIESNAELGDPDYGLPFNDGRPVKQVERHFDYGGDYWMQAHYKATDPVPDLAYDDLDEPACRWKPSIHMPRWASRIQLEITAVRVERLQKISRGDAMDEGCPFPNLNGKDVGRTDPVGWFRNLWESINGSASWTNNPWVWVIEFKRVNA